MKLLCFKLVLEMKLLYILLLTYLKTDTALSECNIPNCVTTGCTGNVCNSCEDGYYLKSNGFCGECPTSCIKCTSLTNCTECIEVRYGTYCQSNCPVGCKNRSCDKGTGRCSYGCGPGYYLDPYNKCKACQFCINGSCDPVSGSCDIGCIDGYFKYTDGSCHDCYVTCKDRRCDRETGACIKGCVENYYLDNLGACHGCPPCCKGLVCEDETGICTHGCIDYYYMTAAKACANCPEECVERKCNSVTGMCDLGCIDQYYMTSYNVCQPCPSSCKNKLCHDKTSFCKEGCIHGYYLTGGTCTECSSRCQDRLCADGSGACDQCIKGYYKTFNGDCNYCPTHCSSCTSPSVCTECKAGYWSSMCSMQCFEGCHYSLCHITEGYCLKGCREGYSDSLCDIPSSRDSMVIGLAVTVGLLSALIITEVVLLIVFCFGKRRGTIKSPRDLLCCFRSGDTGQRANTQPQDDGSVHANSAGYSAGYIDPIWSTQDPQYCSLNGGRSLNGGYEMPVASDNQ